MRRKVLIIQHSDDVRPGYVTEFFDEQNIAYEILRIYHSEAQSTFPENQTEDYFAIVSLGGPQGTYEDELYPYLKWEKAFLAAQLALNTPILGLCLGAQLIADVIGGHGHKGRYGPEVGYVQYELTPEGKVDPVMAKVFEEQDHQPLLVMHHQDSFDLPSSASVLAYTSKKYIAAFRFGSALCVQFHPEAKLEDFNGFVERTRESRPHFYEHMNIEEILREAQACEHQAERSRRLFFQNWWSSLTKQEAYPCHSTADQ